MQVLLAASALHADSLLSAWARRHACGREGKAEIKEPSPVLESFALETVEDDCQSHKKVMLIRHNMIA